MTIAVDMPCLIHKHKGTAAKVGNYNGMNHATRNIFYEVRRLINSGVQLIFVCDGPERPNNKRGVDRGQIPKYEPYEPAKAATLRGKEEKIREESPLHIEWLSKAMLKHLRIPCREAAGEAEAE